MKRLLFLLISLYSCYATSQGSMRKYLEVGEPTNFQELLQWAMNPRFGEEMKTSPDVIEDFVSKASQWEYYSEDDIAKWKACMSYLIDLGVKLNDGGNDESPSLFYLTSDYYMGFGDLSTNKYRLHTTLLELGAYSEAVFDDVSYIYAVLSDSEELDAVDQAYLSDFKKWDIDRKRDWLFSIFSSAYEYEDQQLSIILNKMLNAKALDVNLRSKNEKASLFDVAVRSGRFITAGLLVDNGFNSNQRCFACNGETALHVAVMNSEYNEDEQTQDLIMQMIAKGADPDLRDMKGFTPVHYAILLKCETAFRAFMSPDVTFNYQIGTLKGDSYYTFFEKEWGDQDYLQILAEKTGLKAPPTRKEIAEQRANKKKEEKAKKK